MKLHGALWATLTLLSLAAVADAAKTPTYAITKARVVTVSGAVLENATVVLRDGLVVDVGTNVVIPKDARTFDGTGLTLTPGLIDGYSGAGMPPARPAGGPGGGGAGAGAGPATPPVNPIDPASNIHERLRASDALKARDSGITTIVPIPREGLVFGAAPVLNLIGDKPSTMVVKANVALAANLTTLGQRYPGSLMGAMTFFRQALMDGAHHRADVAAYEKAPSGRKRPAYDPGLDVWADVAAGTTPLLLQTSRVGDLRRAFALADEFKIKLILAGNTQAFEEAALLKEREPSLLVSVNFDPPRVGGFFGGSDDDKDRADIDKAEKNPGLLHKEGLKFALVSGFATDFLAGIRKAIEKGLPRVTALRAVTLTPAEILGVSDRMGSLDKGKIANVVAWSGDPLTKDAKVKMVFIDGELYQPEEKPAGPPAGAGGPPLPETAKAETVDEVKPMAAPAAVAPGTVTAITNAKIMTVGSAGIIEQGTILIKDGKITAVGKDISVPAGATVIDASGRIVTPGIIDAHSHTAVEGGVNECTNIITAEVRVIDALDPKDISIYRQLAGGVTAANVLHGSCNSIGGQNATIKLRWGVDSGDALIFKGAPPGIKFALGENPKRASFGGGTRRYPATRMGVEVSIRDAFLEAKAYKKEWGAYDAAMKAASARKPAKGAPAPASPLAPRKNLQMEALNEILEGKRLVHAHSYRADEILMLIDMANEMGFKIATFQHVLEGYKVATEIAKHGAGASTFSDWWAYKMEAYDAIPYNAAIMASHGVSVSLNSDSDELARRLYWEAAKAVRYGGVSEDEAFKMITINPAKQLGIDKWVGSIEVGKDADLAIFRAHPFAADTRVEMTLVDGRVMFDRSKDVAARTGVSASLGGGK